MKVVDYIKESFIELKTNVTWPSSADVQKLTIVVAVFSIIFALLIFGVDELFKEAVKFIYGFLKS